MPSATSSGRSTDLREPADAVVARVNAHQRRGVRPDRPFVVAEARDVRGADFAERRAADGHDLRDAEAAADLDELAARDDDFLPAAAARSAITVAAAQLLTTVADSAPVSARRSRRDMLLPLRSLAGREIEFEIEVAAAAS